MMALEAFEWTATEIKVFAITTRISFRLPHYDGAKAELKWIVI